MGKKKNSDPRAKVNLQGRKTQRGRPRRGVAKKTVRYKKGKELKQQEQSEETV